MWANDAPHPKPPKLKTTPAEAARIRVVVPSSARPGEPFTAHIVSLDEFWSLSSSTFRDDVLTDQNGVVVAQDVAFTGSHAARVSLDEPGVHRLRFGDTWSNPIRITPEPCGPFGGDLHSRDKTHNCGAGEDPYTYAREVSCLDFLAVTPDYHAIDPEPWGRHVEGANTWNEPSEFATIIGHEVGFPRCHHNLYFGGDAPDFFPTPLDARRSLDDLLATLDPATACTTSAWGRRSSSPIGPCSRGAARSG